MECPPEILARIQEMLAEYHGVTLTLTEPLAGQAYDYAEGDPARAAAWLVDHGFGDV